MKPTNTTLVFGLAVAGRAVARELVARGETVLLADDTVGSDHVAFAKEIGSPIVDVQTDDELDRVLQGVTQLAPAPGVPEQHRVIAGALRNNIEVVSELEIGYRLEQQRVGGPRPMLGITGTDGKTTTTLLACAMLESAGLRAQAVGNTEVPLVAALNTDAQAFAVECSSFRLANTHQFRCRASVWLNFAPDHLDWHSDLGQYFATKAKMWAHCAAGDVAVIPFGDPRIESEAQSSNARIVSFGLDAGDYRVQDGCLVGPSGSIMPVSQMGRSLPHDISNALAAAAVSIESGLVHADQVATALQHFVNPPHRIQFAGEIAGVRWFNDSKATSPHAVAVALRSFESIVLIAGGKNKGLDLSSLASQPSRMRGVVAIGAAQEDVAAAFAGVCRIERASSMQEAVATAASLANSGDVVLLSPGCTSYDWYANYGQRGDDFMKCVQVLMKSKG
jgi:UDP-N-acetylmuramoylalanine--D-glutamate ligase